MNKRHRHFTKEEKQMANKHDMMFNSLNHGKMQTKTTRYHYTPIKVDKIKNSENIKCQQGCGEMNHSHISDNTK